MQRIVVDKRVDIFDYVVDVAIKHHKKNDRFGGPECWNIATRRYDIKFCGANGIAYRKFKAKFNNFEPKKCGVQILRWQRSTDEIEMSVCYYCKKYDHVSKKRQYLSVNYILVNGKTVFKCQPCPPFKPKTEYWFEY